MQVMPILEVFEQRTVRKYAGIHHLDGVAMVTIPQLVLELASEHLFVRHPEAERERVAEQEDAKSPGRLGDCNLRRSQAERVGLHRGIAIAGSKLVVNLPAADPETQIRRPLRGQPAASRYVVRDEADLEQTDGGECNRHQEEGSQQQRKTGTLGSTSVNRGRLTHRDSAGNTR